jgi:hypothetical protein
VSTRLRAGRPRILCISLSTITDDARVLRQIEVLAEFGDVTTLGYGPVPPGVTEHLEVPRELKTLPQTVGGVLNLALRRLRASELAAPAIRWGLDALRGRTFDLVVANEARVLAFAHTVAGSAPVWADMHEWAPEERTHILSWRLLVAPLIRRLCAVYLPKSAAVTAVCGSIADLYDEYYGVRTRVMRNAGPRRELAPTAVDPDAVRLVHSGSAIHGRQIEIMIDVMKRLDARYTLGLYLMPGGDGGRYLQSLRNRAAGDPRIVFHDPVPPATLPDVLNDYDVGVFWIPPTNPNARYSLPNKFFDFVQARLAIAVGPSVEMARLVDEYDLGVVSEGFTVEQCFASISELTTPAIEAAKRASDAASAELSFETDAAVARSILAELLR